MPSQIDKEWAVKDLAWSTSKKRTICEVHREIFDILVEMKPRGRGKILDLLAESHVMAKKMALKLKEYKGSNKETLRKLPNNTNWKDDDNRRTKRREQGRILE